MNTIVIEFKIDGGYAIPKENAEQVVKLFKVLANRTADALLNDQGIHTQTHVYLK